MSSYQYRESHCGDKTILRPSYLRNGFPILVRCHLYIESGPRAKPVFAKLQLQQITTDMNKHRMTSSNRNIFCVTGPLCGEFTSHRWIPLTKASNAELWSFCWIYSWINGWVNNRKAGYLRRHRAHYDVTVMIYIYFGMHHICLSC